MGKCIISSCAVSLFFFLVKKIKKCDIFMAVICDMAFGRLLIADISLESFMIE